MGRVTLEGQCELCGRYTSKAAMSRHIRTCILHHEEYKDDTTELYHLRIEGAHAPIFWLNLEVDGEALLSDLDRFLREIWLQTNGTKRHSIFRIGRFTYTSPSAKPDLSQPNERGLKVKVGEALEPVRALFQYYYDFDNETRLNLRIMGMREGPTSKDKVRLLARNVEVDWTCGFCDQPATKVCGPLLWKGEAFVCDKHAKKAKCPESALVPVTDSPRLGA